MNQLLSFNWCTGRLYRSLPVLVIALLLVYSAAAQTYPPSCVVISPHSNAYFQAKSDIVIRVYSTDIGKSTNNGTVTKVEFYNGTTKLGEASTATSNVYSFTWKCVAAGTYTIKAVATNSRSVTFTSTGVIITVGTAAQTSRGMSAGKGKYLANIIPAAAQLNYNTYWNGVTAENNCKWGPVEGSRDVFSWSGADVCYNHAKNNNMMFRYHAGVWASQYPSWLTSLSTADARAETVEYLTAVAARYPLADQIDVLNEQLGTHQNDNQTFRNLYSGVSGCSQTDYSWQIWLFEQARALFPNTKLILNDYGLENDQSAINSQLGLLKALRDRGLVDGFGTQAHCFNIDALTAAALKSSLDLMATAGLPIYVTELDLNGGVESESNEASQLTSFKTHFPVYWEHPAVAGVSIWGYITGTTWKTGTGLMSSSGTEKSALTWLKSYVTGQTSVGYPQGNIAGSCSNITATITAPAATATFTAPASVTFTATATDGSGGTITKVEYFNNGVSIGSSTTSPYTFTWTNVAAGTYSITAVATNNSGATGTSDPVTVTVKAPAANGTFIVRAKGVTGTEKINLEVDGTVIQVWTLTTSYADYTATANVNGVVRINYTNDSTGRDAQLDYIIVAGTTYQAEDQTINTAYYANSSCGGGSLSEMMHCTGYIEFATNQVTPPNPPTVTTPVTYCQYATATALTATGTALKWYTVATGGAPLAAAPVPSTTTAGSTTYYVSQTVGGVESTMAAIVVTVNASPAAPAAVSPVSYTLNATATALSATGTALKWYTVATGGAASSTAPTPVTTTAGSTSYYVSQTVNSCESLRDTIVVEVLDPSQMVQLKAGWNLIGCPLSGSTAIETALASIWANVLTVKNLDAFYSKDNNTVMNSLTKVEWGRGYYVKVSATCTLTWR